MSKDILDEIEKFKGPRTCPECGYQFPFGKFVKRFVMSYGLSKWPCQGCREMVECDFIKIQFFWLAGLLVYGLLFAVLLPHIDFVLLNVLFLGSYFVFVLRTLYYAKIEKYE